VARSSPHFQHHRLRTTTRLLPPAPSRYPPGTCPGSLIRSSSIPSCCMLLPATERHQGSRSRLATLLQPLQPSHNTPPTRHRTGSILPRCITCLKKQSLLGRCLRVARPGLAPHNRRPASRRQPAPLRLLSRRRAPSDRRELTTSSLRPRNPLPLTPSPRKSSMSRQFAARSQSRPRPDAELADKTMTKRTRQSSKTSSTTK
jgi:hypothetical protein